MEGLDICTDHNGKLIVSVKHQNYIIEEKETDSMTEAGDDYESES